MPVKPLRTVEEGWLSLRAAARLDLASGTQQQEMRRAFFAGVAFTLSEVDTIGDSDDVSEDAGAAHLAMLKAETLMFAAMVGRIPGF
jgi:hypothetical protein